MTRSDIVSFHSEVVERAKSIIVSGGPPAALIKGRHLLEYGMKSGVEMGEILDLAFQAQLDGEFDSVDSGLSWVDELLKGSTS